MWHGYLIEKVDFPVRNINPIERHNNPNTMSSNYIKQNWMGLKRVLDKSTIKFRDFNTTFSVAYRMNSWWNGNPLVMIWKIWTVHLSISAKWHRKHFISTTSKYIFSPRSQGTLRNTGYIPDTSLKWLKQLSHQWRWMADI